MDRSASQHDDAFTLHLTALLYVGDNGRRCHLEVDDVRATDRVQDVKRRIIEAQSPKGLPLTPSACAVLPEDFVLLYADEEMSDSTALGEYGISEDSTVNALLWFDPDSSPGGGGSDG
mmetsp:Transcript_117606/g.293214  ORF Transcript_117606/g.293214 Transcript_117606/m.293214 type:complete len:118 (+) Transcript_117606:86-439(+)